VRHGTEVRITFWVGEPELTTSRHELGQQNRCSDWHGLLSYSNCSSNPENYAMKFLSNKASQILNLFNVLLVAAKSLITFMRSPTWISPPSSVKILDSFKQKASEIEGTQPAGAQYVFTEEEKKRFREDPEYHLKFRKYLESGLNGSWQMFISGSDFSKGVRKAMTAEMNRRLGPGQEELKKKLIPTWAPGCRRLAPGDGYLEALVKANVTRVHSNISEIIPEGLIDETGTIHKCDILVCATGFNIGFAPSFVVRGIDGVTMEDEFNPEPIVYLGLKTPKFPNFFTINGVRGNWAAGSVPPSLDVQCEYIVKCMKRMQAEGIKAMEIKREPVDQLYEHIDEFHKNSVWGEDCKSWYKNNIVGGKLWIWGGSLLHYLKTIRDVR
jgi:cation diffusion facilitator CzcD-associated flavoprotein CzcO